MKFALGVKTSIYNAELRNRRIAKGFSQVELAKYVGLKGVAISDLETFKRYPKYEKLEDIADFLGSDVETMFPEWIREQRIKRSTYEREVLVDRLSIEAPEIKQLGSPREFEQMQEVEGVLRGKVDKALSDILTPYERRIIEMRFGLGDFDRQYTLREIAYEFGSQAERIRQVEARALTKLRRDYRVKPMKRAIGIGPESN